MGIPIEIVVLYIKYNRKLTNNKQCVIPDTLLLTNSMDYKAGKANEQHSQICITAH
jgi:hypothetical protein